MALETYINVFISSGAVATILGYYLYKRKNNAEAATQEATAKQGQATAVESNLKIYQNLIDDLEKRFNSTIAEMEKEIQELKQELHECKRRYLKAS
jgi:predicted RNase H-like nuclease (RuvC/YqgF family)